ncbi:MAG: 1-acyl-sn-glycerol-3-phosphate acyltransferase [Proteobacteria bacterium]|nr:1-acyl-sn-glycerol-3-phosphate acyltransferase [Pseudomonadota bacterium]
MFLSLLALLRFVVSLIDLIVMTVLLYILSFLPTKYVGRWYRKIFRYWCWVFIRALGVKVFLHQKNRVALPKQYILMGNHPSAFEDLGMSALFDVRFLAKIEVKDWWIVGRISVACGTFYVARDSKDSRQEASDTLKQALNQGLSVGLYPEGGCKGRRIFTPFRYGGFELALQTKTPIVPVFLHYEAQEDFEWQNQHLLHKLWMILTAQNHRANYYVYDAIDPTQFSSKEALCEHVQNLYLAWQQRYLE